MAAAAISKSCKIRRFHGGEYQLYCELSGGPTTVADAVTLRPVSGMCPLRFSAGAQLPSFMIFVVSRNSSG